MQHFFIGALALTFAQFCFSQCPNTLSPTPLPFVENFENYADTLSNNDTLVCTPTFLWTFNASHPNGRALCGTGSPVNNGGNGGVTLDVNGFGTFSHNELILTLNLSTSSLSSPIYLSFDCNNVADEANIEDRIFIRGSDQDNWIEIYDWSVLPQNTWISERENIQISNILSSNGQNFSSTFQVKFSQYDNYGYSSDGFAIDNIEIAEIYCTKAQNTSISYQNLDSVILNWDAVPGASWNIQYGLKGFNFGQGNFIHTSNSTDTITQLMPNSVYEVYLQKDCGMSSLSSWVGPLTIYTPITNDSSCNAIFVPADGQTIHTHNKNAGIQFAENFLLGNSPNNTIWFKTIVPNSGHLVIETCLSNFNTKLGAYSISDCSDFTTFTTHGIASFSSPSTQNVCNAPGKAALELCDLTPLDTVFFWIGSYTPTIEDEILFSVADYSLENTSGNAILDSLNTCINDTVNLFSNIQNYSIQGEWNYSENPNAIIDDSLLVAGNMTHNHEVVNYINTNVCDADTTHFNIIISETNYAGNPIEDLEYCNSSTVYLFSTLSGLIQTNGTWYDHQGNDIFDDQVYFSNTTTGIQQFTYIVNNNACPADSVSISFDLLDCTLISENSSERITISNIENKLFEVSSPQKSTLNIYDLQGKALQSNIKLSPYEPKKIDLSNKPAGVYILIFNGLHQSKIRKVVTK